jgi:glucosamine-6-phosphate deaminase
MEVLILPTAHEVCLRAARIIARVVRDKPRAVLGLCTGTTPIPVYAELVRMHRDEGLDFSQLTTFNLDEWVGVPPDHPASFQRYMREHLFDHVNIRKENGHLPDGLASDIPTACAAYEDAILAAGGIDVQLLGIGADGHVAFNEPSSSLGSRTRLKTLTAETLATYRAGWPAGESPPQHVITMGVGTILMARRCVWLACGAAKAKAVAKSIEGPVTAFVPASSLQLHPHVTAIVDEAAARDLALGAYYRDVERHKPDWQREE